MAGNIFDDFSRQNEPPSDDFQWLDLRHAVESKPPVLDYVLPCFGFLSGTVGALVSPGGTGKSVFALQIATQVAGGPDLLGLGELPTGRVVYLTGEDPTEMLSHRVHAIGQHLSPAERESVYERLSVASVRGYGADVMNLKWRRWIVAATEDSRLVVIDTLRRFHRLDENAGGEMAAVLDWLEWLSRVNKTTVLFLHHTNKSAAMLGAGDRQQASRGSSVLVDNVRWQGNLMSMTSAEAEAWGVDESRRRYFIRFSVSKTNYAPPVADRWYRRLEGGVLKPAVLEKREQQRKNKGGRDYDAATY